MGDMSKVEKAKAAREATDHVAASRPSSSAAAVEAAMHRYLSAEQYHELNERQEPATTEQGPTDRPA
jgi:hypothetical protein